MGEICNFLKVYTFISSTEIPNLSEKLFQVVFLIRWAILSLQKGLKLLFYNLKKLNTYGKSLALY